MKIKFASEHHDTLSCFPGVDGAGSRPAGHTAPYKCKAPHCWEGRRIRLKPMDMAPYLHEVATEAEGYYSSSGVSSGLSV